MSVETKVKRRTLAEWYQSVPFATELVLASDFDRSKQWLRHIRDCYGPTATSDCTCGLTAFIAEMDKSPAHPDAGAASHEP